MHPDYKGSMLGYLLVKKMYDKLMKEGADILCCTMASGNDAVIPFFKGRAGIPSFTEAAKFNIYQVLPAHHSKLLNTEKTEDKTRIVNFFNDCFKKYSFKPYKILPHELNDCINFSAENGENPNAAIAAFDPSSYKQNIVTQYSFSISLLLAVLRFFKLFFKLPSLPEKHVPLRIIYAKYYGWAEGKEKILKCLIQQLRHYAFKKNYHLVAIATDEKDSVMNKLLKPISRFVFKSTLLVTSLQKNQEIIDEIKQGICLEDYSLV